MTQYLKPKFTVPLTSREYGENWDRVFGRTNTPATRRQGLKELTALTEQFGGYESEVTAPTSTRLDTLRHEEGFMDPVFEDVLLRNQRLQAELEQARAECAAMKEAAARVVERDVFTGDVCDSTAKAIRALEAGPVAREFMEWLEEAEQAATEPMCLNCKDTNAMLMQERIDHHRINADLRAKLQAAEERAERAMQVNAAVQKDADSWLERAEALEAKLAAAEKERDYWEREYRSMQMSREAAERQSKAALAREAKLRDLLHALQVAIVGHLNGIPSDLKEQLHNASAALSETVADTDPTPDGDR